MMWPSCDGASAGLLFSLCLAISYLSSCVVTMRDTKGPIITIPQGKIQGIRMHANNSRRVYGFMGVPYAKPPIGNLRFKAPEAPTPWKGTFDASQDDKSCLQVVSGTVKGNEDCLYLNLYTPKLPLTRRTKLMPVVVFVVGGAFETGNNTKLRYGPDYLLTKDIVLVVPDYRVGILGFLSTGDEVAPGNFGLKDLVMGLQWVRNNIKYFGGDPNQVTLAGASSGAMAASWLAVSKAANKGLFHRYITESGSALIPNVRQANPSYVEHAYTVAKHFDCPRNSSELMIECLRGLTGAELTNTDALFFVWRSFPGEVWRPTVEPDIEGALMTNSPAKLMAEGKFSDLPWLVSTNRDEGMTFAMQFYRNLTFLEEFLKNIDIALPELLGYGQSSSNAKAFTEGLKAYYLNDLTANQNVILANISQMCGDVLFLYPAYSELKQRLSRVSSPAYYMSFEYRGVFSYTYTTSGGCADYTNVTHGDEIIYLFRNRNNLFGPASWSYSKNDWKIVQTMVRMWQNFIIGGKPTPKHGIGKLVWPPYDHTENYLQLGNGFSTEMVIKHKNAGKRMEYLDNLAAAVPWLTD